MANEKQPTPEQRPLLEDLRRAAVLRSESYRLYLALFERVLRAGVGPSVIARYARITPQAAHSTRIRLAGTPLDKDAPETIADVLGRVDPDGANDAPPKHHPQETPPPNEANDISRSEPIN
jgi:hypothetical protein